MEWVWFIVAIVAITQVGDLASKWLKLKAKEAQLSPESDARIRELEQRVATLERIATDDKSRLKETINAL